jgi:hypothetical protein
VISDVILKTAFTKILIPILLIFLLACCNKSKDYQEEGTITGVDYALCVCCGGVILEVKDLPGNFRIDSLPFMPVQKLYGLSFPQRIQFNYSGIDSCAGIRRFTITAFFMGN